MSSGPTCSIFCFHTSGRTHSNCVSAPHSAHAPMAHLPPYNSTVLVGEELDRFGRLRFLAFISHWQSTARPRESHRGSYRERARASRSGGSGDEGFPPPRQNRSGVRRLPGPARLLSSPGWNPSPQFVSLNRAKLHPLNSKNGSHPRFSKVCLRISHHLQTLRGGALSLG